MSMYLLSVSNKKPHCPSRPENYSVGHIKKKNERDPPSVADFNHLRYDKLVANMPKLLIEW